MIWAIERPWLEATRGGITAPHGISGIEPLPWALASHMEVPDNP